MKLNLEQLQNSLTDERVIELMEFLGADSHIEKNDCIIFPTICHNEECCDASMKLYYYKKNKRFHCYTECGCNFNIYNLFVRRYELIGYEYNFYTDIIGVIAQGSKLQPIDNGFYERYESAFGKYNKNKPQVEMPILKPSLLNIYSRFYAPEWIEDGISPEAMDTFNIRYSIPQNKIVIPHYDMNGNLIGIRGRALNPADVAIAKYMPIMENGIIYAHPLGYNVYGLNMNKANIAKRKIAIIAESEKSVLQFETFYGRARNVCVAVCGSNFSQYQFELVRKAGAERVIIAFDKEGKTWDKQCSYQEKLKHICLKYSNYCQMGYIWDTKKLLDLKDSPTDKGREVFEQLYKGVVWI